ncbi:hypothetical protein EBB07_30055 [Paenibacillaceae bacterium]|nr:hypothetical protein EBB07_30055 [Paenibacillaceae bacterium]
MYQPPQPSLQDWAQWAQQTQRFLLEQQQRLTGLEQRIAALESQVKETAGKPSYHIDKLEYHFDQLKVEKLDGTLNIGMALPSEEQLQSVDQWEVPAPAPASAQTPGSPGQGPSDDASPMYQQVYQNVDQYLQNDAPDVLARLEMQSGITFDPYHRSIIIGDLRKQLSPRIRYYMNTVKTSEQINDAEQTQIGDEVASKTVRDIELAMQQYIRSIQASTAPAAPAANALPVQHSGIDPFGGE